MSKKEMGFDEIAGLQYLNVKELSILIRKSEGAVRNLVLRRAIPFHKPGGRLLFVRSEIDSWVRSS